MPTDLDTQAREQLSRVLRDHPDPLSLDLDEDLVQTYGITSLNKVLFLTSLCRATGVGLDSFTEEDLAAMRTLGDVVGALRVRSGEAAAPSRVAWSESAVMLLQNEQAELHPVTEDDRAPLRKIAFNDRIWKYFVSRIENDADFEKFFDAMLADQDSGKRAVYVIVDKPTGQVAGSSSYGNMSETDGRLEIGWSWLGVDFQGQGVNRWAKYLLLNHAFDVMGAERVEFKTDILNAQARAALRNIGGYEEGVLRSFNPMPGGRRRDAVYYSVLRAEWPAIRDQLVRVGKVVRPCP